MREGQRQHVGTVGASSNSECQTQGARGPFLREHWIDPPVPSLCWVPITRLGVKLTQCDRVCLIGQPNDAHSTFRPAIGGLAFFHHAPESLIVQPPNTSDSIFFSVLGAELSQGGVTSF